MPSSSPTLLALDAAGSACSAAFWAGGRVAARRFEAMSRGQSERLVPMVQEVMAEAGAAFADLDGVAVTLGPGGFTGVRIGLATARGLALAQTLPLLGITSFEAVAAAVPAAEQDGRTLAVALDAKRVDLYLQAFHPQAGPLGAPLALPPEALDGALPPGPLLLAGDAAAAAADALTAAGREVALASSPGLADAAWVAAVAAARSLPDPAAPLPGPLYLRPPDVTLPGVKG